MLRNRHPGVILGSPYTSFLPSAGGIVGFCHAAGARLNHIIVSTIAIYLSIYLVYLSICLKSFYPSTVSLCLVNLSCETFPDTISILCAKARPLAPLPSAWWRPALPTSLVVVDWANVPGVPHAHHVPPSSRNGMNMWQNLGASRLQDASSLVLHLPFYALVSHTTSPSRSHNRIAQLLPLLFCQASLFLLPNEFEWSLAHEVHRPEAPDP